MTDRSRKSPSPVRASPPHAGYASPTPLTVLSAQDLIGNSANSDVKDSLQELPVFAGGGYNTTYGAGCRASMRRGVSTLEMHDLGITRTLVLIDGMRAVGSLANGLVDYRYLPAAARQACGSGHGRRLRRVRIGRGRGCDQLHPRP